MIGLAVIVLIISSSIGYVYAQKIIGYSESTITVEDPNERTYCVSNEIEPTDLVAKDLAGNVKKQISADSQFLLQGVVNNNGCPVPDYPVLILFEVRDSDDITKYLVYQNVTLSPDQEDITLGVSWVAEEADDYTARLFTLHRGVRLLSPVLTYNFTAHR